MKEKVFWIKVGDNEDDEVICRRLHSLIRRESVFAFVEDKDMTAVKTHFGEKGSDGYVRPLYFKMLAEEIKTQGGQPFLTETSTLYRGQRANAVDHIQMAYEHGFTFENTGLPIIMADGLLGDEEIEVPTGGTHYKTVKLANLIVKAQALVVVSHFTGHLATGFGGALKNMGMGCASRRGKMIQHSTAKPSIKISKCVGCGECVKWCPQDAITLAEGKAQIDRKKCIGCGECLAVCRFEAVGYNWGETYEHLQQKVVEHARGVAECKRGKIICFNFLTRITKDCDCMGEFKKIVPDLGVLVSFDPVAIDNASLDLVEQAAAKKLSSLAYNIPYKVQIDHAGKIGFGNPDYELIKI
jgi:hypothetical protein